MNSEMKAKWVEALESGEYSQGEGHLAIKTLKTNEVKYCCLGVLCEINNLRDGEYKREKDWVLAYSYKDSVGSDALLPRLFREEIGLSDKMQGRLTTMNDNGKTFNEIAAYIKENWNHV